MNGKLKSRSVGFLNERSSKGPLQLHHAGDEVTPFAPINPVGRYSPLRADPNIFRLEPSLDLEHLGTRQRDHSGNYRNAVCSLCSRTVAIALQVSLDALNSPDRENGETSKARQIAMYLSATMFNLCATEVGRAFKRDRTTVAYALERIEEQREDPEFDFILVQLEDLLSDARHAISLCYDYFDGGSVRILEEV
ncbi:DnaA related protein [Ahrensia sp. R2A130]|nr:DnaA related protein [Ahrensia sp. R2A130]